MHILALIIAFGIGAYRTRDIWLPICQRILKWADERSQRAEAEARKKADAEALRKAEEERRSRFHTYPYGEGTPPRTPKALPAPDEARDDTTTEQA